MFKAMGGKVFVVLFCIISAVYSASIPTGLWPVFDSRIVGGKPIDITEVPYMASVVHYGAHYCGGAIISDMVILTAAHCTPGITERRTKIRVGSSYRSTGRLLSIQKILPHEEYKHYLEGRDVALIWLQIPLRFSNTVQMVRLPSLDQPLAARVMARVTGWGHLSTRGPVSEQLMAVDVPVVERDRCFEAFRAWISVDMICAGYRTGGKDACLRDSGGPLVVNNTVVGIVSWGNKCALPDYFGVYTNVAHFYDWIIDKMENSSILLKN